MRFAVSLAIVALLTSLAGPPGRADEPAIEEARRILGEAVRDPSAIERARDHLEGTIRGSGAERADPPTLIELSRLWYLHGELRAPAGETRIAAFDRGRTLGETAVRRAPRDAYAHLWYAVNLARWAEERGILRSILELSTVKGEVDETLRLAPDLPDAHVFAGGLARHLPGFLGGDQARAEEHFRRAVALDPRRTRFRLELAELLIELERPDEARIELLRLVGEATPSDPLFAALHDRPRARRLLAELD
ncbi:MAG: tetratricopeptide repeat protein [Candidatus Binatia bacterium]